MNYHLTCDLITLTCRDGEALISAAHLIRLSKLRSALISWDYFCCCCYWFSSFESIDLILLSDTAHRSLMLHDGATFEKLTDTWLTDPNMEIQYYVMRHVGDGNVLL